MSNVTKTVKLKVGDLCIYNNTKWLIISVSEKGIASICDLESSDLFSDNPPPLKTTLININHLEPYFL